MNNKGKKENLSNAGKGRPRGCRNKFTNLKESFLDAFEQLGGTKALIAWAKDKKNRKDFYLMLSKMLPSKIDFDERPSITVVIEEGVSTKRGS